MSLEYRMSGCRLAVGIDSLEEEDMVIGVF
jgi:hypothetical protein